MRWRKLREVEWVASLIQMVATLLQQHLKTIIVGGAGAMNALLYWIESLPSWVHTVSMMLLVLVGLVVFERKSKEKQEAKSSKNDLAEHEEPNRRISELESDLSRVSAERDRYKKESKEKASELTVLDAKLKLAMNQVKVVENERDKYKQQVEEQEKRLVHLRSEFRELEKRHGRWWITQCGQSDAPLGLSILVQFIEPSDAGLAQSIGSFFSARGIWITKDIESILWFRNPSNRARIVIFSNHPHANGLKAAFNDCKLLGEPVDKLEMGRATAKQSALDIAIVVFPREQM